MKVCRGKVHEYLGMTLDFSTMGKVKVTMFPYIKSMVDDFTALHPTSKTSATPAAEHLFKVRDDAILLDEQASQTFHTFVAKALFATKRARPDIHTVVAFLTTRVMTPDEDDWKKLVRMIQYLQGSLQLPLTLEADNFNIVKWWVDGAYGVHPDCRSQTGGTASLGKGSIISTSLKQKLNTRSSTETELVAADDMMPHLCWTNYFLQCQYYHVLGTVMYQDNKSAILLETNGKRSSSKRTKHINIRYFFITDRIQNQELNIEYCPTGLMIADFFTKPLQGKKFLEFRSAIMNLSS
jgi:hypothetical protein